MPVLNFFVMYVIRRWLQRVKRCLHMPSQRALFSFPRSLHPDGTLDPASLHGSCPTLKGNKWSATKWIHVRAAALLRPMCCCTPHVPKSPQMPPSLPTPTAVQPALWCFSSHRSTPSPPTLQSRSRPAARTTTPCAANGWLRASATRTRLSCTPAAARRAKCASPTALTHRRPACRTHSSTAGAGRVIQAGLRTPCKTDGGY